MGTGGEVAEEEEEDEEEGEFVIPPEQYEQDMQAEDEQYIQAGTEGLSGQQRGSNFPTGRRGQYDLTAMVRAYADCLQPGTHSVARVARHYSVPRKTLENYVTGRTSIQTLYRKLEGGGFLQNKPA